MEMEEGRKINPKAVVILIVVTIGLPIVIWAVFTYPILLYGLLLVGGILVYAKLKSNGIIQ